MSAEHYSDTELIAILYAGEDGRNHLAGCIDCRGRISALEEWRKQLVASSTPIPEGLLVRQRNAIYARLEEPRGRAWRPAAAFAATAAFALAMVVYVPKPAQPESTAPAAVITDAQLFSDAAAMVADPEPRAAEPLLAMFESENPEEVRR